MHVKVPTWSTQSALAPVLLLFLFGSLEIAAILLHDFLSLGHLFSAVLAWAGAEPLPIVTEPEPALPSGRPVPYR